jgi:hypothetical protein
LSLNVIELNVNPIHPCWFTRLKYDTSNAWKIFGESFSYFFRREHLHMNQEIAWFQPLNNGCRWFSTWKNLVEEELNENYSE